VVIGTPLPVVDRQSAYITPRCVNLGVALRAVYRVALQKPESDLPDSQVELAGELERSTRRRYSTEYKLRIVAEADACERGQVGELLRREKLYSSQLQQWRRELEQEKRV